MVLVFYISKFSLGGHQTDNHTNTSSARCDSWLLCATQILLLTYLLPGNSSVMKCGRNEMKLHAQCLVTILKYRHYINKFIYLSIYLHAAHTGNGARDDVDSGRWRRRRSPLCRLLLLLVTMHQLMPVHQWTGAVVKHVQCIRYGARRLRHDMQLDHTVVLTTCRLLLDQRLATVATSCQTYMHTPV